MSLSQLEFSDVAELWHSRFGIAEEAIPGLTIFSKGSEHMGHKRCEFAPAQLRGSGNAHHEHEEHALEAGHQRPANLWKICHQKSDSPE